MAMCVCVWGGARRDRRALPRSLARARLVIKGKLEVGMTASMLASGTALYGSTDHPQVVTGHDDGKISTLKARIRVCVGWLVGGGPSERGRGCCGPNAMTRGRTRTHRGKVVVSPTSDVSRAPLPRGPWRQSFGTPSRGHSWCACKCRPRAFAACDCCRTTGSGWA